MIDDRHPREAPVVGLGLDHAVDVGEVIDGAAKDFRGELTRVRLRLLQVLEGVDDHVRTVVRQIVLIEHLQRQLPCFSTRAHYVVPLRTARHRLAISIAASAASQPLLPLPAEERSTA